MALQANHEWLGALHDGEWVDVCGLDDVPKGTGAAALIRGEQVAVIRAADGAVYALSNFDPFSNAFVIARGIVGDRAGTPKIASPIYKQSFSLESGECLDDPTVRLRTFRVRLIGARVHIDAASVKIGA